MRERKEMTEMTEMTRNAQAICLWLLLLLILLITLARPVRADWTMVRGDATNEGRTQFPVGLDHHLWLSAAFDDEIVGVVSGGSFIYLAFRQGKVEAWDLATIHLRAQLDSRERGIEATGEGAGFRGATEPAGLLEQNWGWSRRLPTALSACPALHTNWLLCPGLDHNLYFIDRNTGSISGKLTFSDDLRCPPIVVGDVAYLGCDDHRLYKVDLKRGNVLWKVSTEGEIVAAPAFHDGRVFVGSTDHRVYCFHDRHATPAWRQELDDDIVNPVVVDRNRNRKRVYVLTGVGSLWALDQVSGEVVWKSPSPFSGSAPPALTGDGIVVLSRTGEGWLLDAETGMVREKWTVGFATSAPVVTYREVHFLSSWGTVLSFNFNNFNLTQLPRTNPLSAPILLPRELPGQLICVARFLVGAMGRQLWVFAPTEQEPIFPSLAYAYTGSTPYDALRLLPNVPHPIAEAKPDRATISDRTLMVFDGRNSYCPLRGYIASYRWIEPLGNDPVIQGIFGTGRHAVVLLVRDEEGAVGRAMVIFDVLPPP